MGRKKSHRLNNRCKKRNSSKWVRSGKFNRHHIINKCRGGQATTENLLILDTRRHEAWHLLFHNLSFEEVIELLKRTIKAKQEQAKRLNSYTFFQED